MLEATLIIAIFILIFSIGNVFITYNQGVKMAEEQENIDKIATELPKAIEKLGLIATAIPILDEKVDTLQDSLANLSGLTPEQKQKLKDAAEMASALNTALTGSVEALQKIVDDNEANENGEGPAPV